jgi:hypothetical protein
LDSHNTSSLRSDGCNRCFPDYDGGVKGVSLDVLHPKRTTCNKPLTSIRHSVRKNVASHLAWIFGKEVCYNEEGRYWVIKKLKGVRFY